MLVQRKADVFEHVHVVEESGVLKEHSELAPDLVHFLGPQFCDLIPFNVNLPFVGRD
jgi:hypothetical protein